MELLEHLKRREAAEQRIRVGIVGCGQMGSGMVHVTHRMPGMRIVALADIDPGRPRHTLEALSVPAERICTTSSLAEANEALTSGKYLVTEEAALLSRVEGLDAVVEATGSTEVGAQVAWSCILNGRNVIMLNVETDVTVGVFLERLARGSGCVYTAASGDEPGVCKSLYDFACSLGFEVVCVGKGKNNPINLYADPDSARREALSRNMNPKMLAAFQDGTKTMVEMAALANATGMVPDVPGMHGLQVDLDQLNRVYVPKADGGVLEHRGCVEYSTGKVAPGVFVICTSPDARVRQDMKFVGMGSGPYYLLYRPYHLCNIETPISVAEAVIYGERTLAPRRMVAEVVAVAKRNLKAGERVGEIGGPELYHRIYRYEEARAARGIPMGLATGGQVLKDIPRDALLTEENFAPDTTRTAYRLRQLQDEMLAAEEKGRESR
jgi:predicted homoserine dehydrogenase-like protein